MEPPWWRACHAACHARAPRASARRASAARRAAPTRGAAQSLAGAARSAGAREAAARAPDTSVETVVAARRQPHTCSQLQSLAAPLPSHFRSPDLESRTQNRQENTLRLQRRRAARLHACSNHCLRAQSTCVEDPCEVHHRPPQAPLTVYTLRERRTCRANRTRSAGMRDACCSGGQRWPSVQLGPWTRLAAIAVEQLLERLLRH